MKRRAAAAIFLSTTAVALALVTSFAASAGASPNWRFSGSLLSGSETIAGSALEDRFTFPGLTTKCELTYKMNIANSAGIGKGEVTGLLLNSCTTASKVCTVKTAAAEKLPWPLHLATVGTNIYVILEKVRFSLLYAGEECALGETLVTITGTAGGLFNNLSSTINFTPSSFSSTKTELKAFGTKVEWNCILTTEATGAHIGEALEVG